MRRTAVLALVLAAATVGCGASAKPPPPYDPPDERFVLFGSGSSDVTSSDGFFALGYVVAMLEEHPSFQVLIVGHADTSGASSRNRDLCFLRARAARKILVSHGVSEARVLVAAPREIDSTTTAMLSRRADVYLYDPAREDIDKRLGYPVEMRSD